jgi:hypothetical protein
MPHRHAHFYLLLLIPLVALAFWPAYFSVLRTAPIAFHVHGVTASLWILLLIAQSWTIHARRNALHRTIGFTSFALFPLFVIGGLMVMQTMARSAVGGAHPFYALYGARLAAIDVIATVGLAAFFYVALKRRRQVQLHARYMLATIIFLFSPILGRLVPFVVPALRPAGPDDLAFFAGAVQVANAATLGIALFLAWRSGRFARPYLVAAGLVVLQILGFEYLAQTAAWQAVIHLVARLPTSGVVAVGLAASAAILWLGWNAAPGARRPLRPA